MVDTMVSSLMAATPGAEWNFMKKQVIEEKLKTKGRQFLLHA
jgi:hypothetical protein